MKVFKKILAVLCSATLIVAAPVTAFAEGEAPSSTAGAGNILAYSFDTVTVPTTIKLTFNPQQLAVRTGGTDEAPVTSTEQIVSLNYGIANKATDDKKIIVGFAATAESGTGTAVTFVDEETKAEAKTDSNTGGAEPGDLKMYLAVASASAAPKADASTPFAVTDVTDGKNTENASASALSNVDMTAATAGNVAFAAGTNNYAFANIGYKLGKAAYSLIDAGSVDFDTVQSEVKDKLEMTALGDVDGFTFVGKMNPNANWTTANITALSITPIYTITDADGTETAAATGVYKQITLTAEEKAAEPTIVVPATTYTVTYNANYDGAEPATKTETVDIGEAPQGGSEYEFTRDGYTQDGWVDAEGTAVDLSTIEEATTVYANWVEDEPAVTTYALRLMTATGNLRYDFDSDSKPTGSVTAVTINGTNRPATVSSGNISYDATEGYFLVKNTVVNNADFGIAQGSTTIVATIGGTEYTFTY